MTVPIEVPTSELGATEGRMVAFWGAKGRGRSSSLRFSRAFSGRVFLSGCGRSEDLGPVHRASVADDNISATNATYLPGLPCL